MAGYSLRELIDLIEGKIKPSAEPWTVSQSDTFADSMARIKITFPDIQDKLEKFIDVKIPNPLANRYGKHDGPMTGPLIGFFHCHLRDDALLIYRLVQRSIFLVSVVTHADTEGKRGKNLRNSLQQYLK